VLAGSLPSAEAQDTRVAQLTRQIAVLDQVVDMREAFAKREL
jgi:hypothetical protein